MTTSLFPVPDAASSVARLMLDEVRRAPCSLDQHLELHGPLPMPHPETILDEVERAGLTGRGGAGFPAHRKLRAVAAGTAPRVVVANAAEGEPASAKDATLLRTNPHLVLDGLQIAARAVGARDAYIYVHHDGMLPAQLAHAVRERHRAALDALPVRVVTAPASFVAGEESAVAAAISGHAAVPRSKPPRVFESGVHGLPTGVHNAETLAHIAVIARIGGEAFRSVGPPDQPGTMLFTVSGAVEQPGVVELPVGVPLGDVIEAAGGAAALIGAVLLGGFHGGWLPWPEARDLPMANAVLRPHRLSVGAGVVVALPADVCGVTESIRVLRYLAGQSAGQCGPCAFGLPQLARAWSDSSTTGLRARHQRKRLDALAAALERRGGCAHPDGSVRFLRSARTVFAAEFERHAHGQCSATSNVAVLPTPGVRD